MEDSHDLVRQQIFDQQAESEEEGPSGRVEDLRHEEYKHVSNVTLSIDRIPQDILSRSHKVFSKHQPREIREWAQQLMKSYQLLHAGEKPMNLDYVKPYANTSDLVNMTPNLNENLALEK